MKMWVRFFRFVTSGCAVLAALCASPLQAEIIGFNTDPVKLNFDGWWYLNGTNRLARFAVINKESGEIDANEEEKIIDEAVYFPFEVSEGFHFMANSSSNKVEKFSKNEENWAQNMVIFEPNDGEEYLPYYRSQSGSNPESAIAFEAGIWGHFEPDPDESGYFAFRFDLNADGDTSVNEFQYGWGRISFSEIVNTSDSDVAAFSITLHEWAWGGIGDTDFPIGGIPEPSVIGLTSVIGLAVYLTRRFRW